MPPPPPPQPIYLPNVTSPPSRIYSFLSLLPTKNTQNVLCPLIHTHPPFLLHTHIRPPPPHAHIFNDFYSGCKVLFFLAPQISSLGTLKARSHRAHFPSADCNSRPAGVMFDIDSWPTIVKSAVESADSGIESADSTAESAINPLRIGLWVWGFNLF